MGACVCAICADCKTAVYCQEGREKSERKHFSDHYKEHKRHHPGHSYKHSLEKMEVRQMQSVQS